MSRANGVGSLQAEANAAHGAVLPAATDGYLDRDLRRPVKSRDADGWNWVKRCFDVAVAGMLLLFALPLMVAVAVAIAWERDGGRVFYGQKRIGREGREFTCLKFRSMCPDASARLARLLTEDDAARSEWAETQKLRNDPRVTRVGRFLRSSSLDELPQLLNVVRGDMSLVGPRPVTRDELNGPYVRFDGVSEYLSVRPGITGLWQVSGRSLVGYEDRVRLDKAYVRNRSAASDVRILFNTVGVVFRREGAC